MKTPFRPALLNSAIARDNVQFHDKAEIAGIFAAIDKKAQIWDALEAVRVTVDPLVTKEAAALRYKATFETAIKRATEEVRTAADRALAARDRLRADAYGKAGLSVVYGNEQELRAVLRNMKQPARDAAIAHAIKVGDHAVMAAIHGAHELLVGETTVPIKTLIEQFVAEHAPEEMAQVENIDVAITNLEMSYQQFAHSAEKMRDREAEAAGEAGAKAAREAEARLGQVLAATAV